MNIPINIETLLEDNGSPPAKYDTDGDNRQFFIKELPIHPEFIVQDRETGRNQVRNQDTALINNEEEVRAHIRDQVGDQVTERIIQTLRFCFEPKTKREILGNLSLSNKSTNFKKNIQPAIDAELLAMTIPDKITSKHQKYITTEKGKKILGRL